MAKTKFRSRNTDLALAQQYDPERFRTRTVESKKRKMRNNRRRSKEAWLNDSD